MCRGLHGNNVSLAFGIHRRQPLAPPSLIPVGLQDTDRPHQTSSFLLFKTKTKTNPGWGSLVKRLRRRGFLKSRLWDSGASGNSPEKGGRREARSRLEGSLAHAFADSFLWLTLHFLCIFPGSKATRHFSPHFWFSVAAAEHWKGQGFLVFPGL